MGASPLARDQPGVYETPNVSALPAAAMAEDSHNAGLDGAEMDDAVAGATGHGPAEFSDGEDTDSVVVRTRLSVRAAAGTFANAGVDASGAEFSGAVSSRTTMFRTYNRAAYKAPARSRAVRGSPAQKLARLFLCYYTSGSPPPHELMRDASTHAPEHGLRRPNDQLASSVHRIVHKLRRGNEKAPVPRCAATTG
ncbi:hypothetical protein H9P43_003467 [Blastocladiella emersonii ATCC 22665]|nr:hypothetical protein H9P43_003467 [Blastocladiella emersonii ATCC 22665]